VTVGLIDAVLTVSRITKFKDEPLVNSRLKFVSLLAIAPWLLTEFMGYGQVIFPFELYQIRASTIGTFVTFAALIGSIHLFPNQIRKVMNSPETAWAAIKRGVAKVQYELTTRLGICGSYLRKLPSQFKDLTPPEKRGRQKEHWPDHWNGKGTPKKSSSVVFPKGEIWASFTAHSVIVGA
jgi:hypothetical protein